MSEVLTHRRLNLYSNAILRKINDHSNYCCTSCIPLIIFGRTFAILLSFAGSVLVGFLWGPFWLVFSIICQRWTGKAFVPKSVRKISQFKIYQKICDLSKNYVTGKLDTALAKKRFKYKTSNTACRHKIIQFGWYNGRKWVLVLAQDAL